MIYVDINGNEFDYPVDEPDDSIPPGVGPHEGREFSLMLAGRKHVALFSEVRPKQFDDLPIQDFDCNHWAEMAGLNNDIPIGCWIYYRKGHESDAATLKSLRLDASPAAERETGRILGYTVAEVEAFLRHRETVRASEP